MRLLAAVASFYAKNFTLSIRQVRWLERFLQKNPYLIKQFLIHVDPQTLWKSSETKLLYLIAAYLRDTPALQGVKKKFFANRDVSTRVDVFKQYFPILDKKTYFELHSIAELARGGSLPRGGCFYTSAGTTGKPTVWIESVQEEIGFEGGIRFIADLMVNVRNKEYIVLNCWALGSWPTGINFFSGMRHLAKVANVGTNVKAGVEIMQIMGPKYPYVVAGYPPSVYQFFLECERQNLDVSHYAIDVVTGGEGYTEEWRDAVLQKVGPERTIFSVYGSTDKGLTEGLETNFAYALRSLMYVATTLLGADGPWAAQKAQAIMEHRFGTGNVPFESPDAAHRFLRAFFKEDELRHLPMVFQFNPLDSYIENLTTLNPDQGRHVREFVSTVLSPITPLPRVRYNIHDEGFMMTYQEVVEILKKFRIDISRFNPRRDKYLDLHLPFLFLFGRSDGTISVDGANIFTEDISRCLYANVDLAKEVKSFQLFTTGDYRFGIALELQDEMHPTGDISEKFRRYFIEQLSAYSLGYQEIKNEHLHSADIAVEVYATGTGPFENAGIKHRYVRPRSLSTA